MTSRRDVGARMAGGVALVALAACATTHPSPYPELSRVGRDAIEAYLEAKRAWIALAAHVPASDAELRGAQDAVLRHLETARAHDPRSPLFASRIAALHAARGEDDAAAAEYRQALAVVDDWVPAHLGLGTFAVRAGDLDAAAAHLANAELAVASLELGAPRAGSEGFELLGIRFGGPGARRPEELARGDAVQLALNMLYEDQHWDPARIGAGEPASSQAGTFVRGLRARVTMLEFGIQRTRAPLDLAAQEALLEKARRFDPDLWQGKYWRAQLSYEKRDYRQAETLLHNAFWGNHGILLARDPSVRQTYLRVCLDWFLDGGGTDAERRAVDAFDRVAGEVEYLRGRAPMLHAAQGYCAGVALARPEPFRLARRALLEWRPPGLRDEEMRNKLLAAIERRLQQVELAGGRR